MEHTLIVGEAGTGKTTELISMIEQAKQANPGVKLYIINNDQDERLDRLAMEGNAMRHLPFQQVAPAEGDGPAILAIDNIVSLLQEFPILEQSLGDMLATCRKHGRTVLMTAQDQKMVPSRILRLVKLMKIQEVKS